MNPRAYVPAYLEHRYALAHPELTNAARELVHEQIERDPDRYATDDGARALVSYMPPAQADALRRGHTQRKGQNGDKIVGKPR